ncbi:2-aminoethylphosphonate ABC transport system ATP-binding subunit PhnT [Salmonella enterica]|nr:2-aminoethylphosphonate ABC transport system ATP-binding subunit PhnT [Salmonella enterica]
MLMKTTTVHAPASQGTSGIVLDSLRVAYHGNVVLKPLSLTIEPGEVLALIGPSGSGKTTVLRAVAGFVQPAGGRILIGDTDVTHLPPYKRGLAMVVQNYALFPHLKVEDNVAFGLRAQKQPKALINERVTQALKTVGMSDYAARYPHQLSGGQQQRVAIARAIAVRPRVLLLDEPLSALDAQIRHNMVEEIARLHRELPELTILYVTHDQTEALTLADKIGIMKDGSLIAHGETRALYQHPPNRFAAEFLGRANILSAIALGITEAPGLVLATLFFWPLSLIVEQALRGANGEIGLETFRQVVDSKRFVGALLNTLQIAFFATAGCLLLGSVMSLILVFIPFPGSELIGRVVDTFIALPTFLITLAFTFIYGSAGLLNGTLMSLFAFELPPVDFLYSMQGVILAEITVFTPLVMRPLMAALRQIDKSQLEAASILGAHPLRVIGQVIFPAALPALMAGGSLCLLLTTNEFGIVLFIGAKGVNTLPMMVYSKAILESDYTVACMIALINIVLSLGLFSLYRLAASRTGVRS